jgi:hypothetical protein
MITTRDMASFDCILMTASTEELNTLKGMIEKRQKDMRDQEYHELATKAFYAIKAVADRFPNRDCGDYLDCAYTWEDLFEGLYTNEVGEPDEFE